MSDLPPPHLPTAYPPQDDPAGYMPLSEVYAALDFILHCASNTESHRPATRAARDFLASWLQLGPSPGVTQLQTTQQALTVAAAAVAAAFQEALAGFISDLASHPSPGPGSVFGAYHRELSELQLQP